MQRLRFLDQVVVLVPVVARRVREVDVGHLAGVLVGRDVLPDELEAQRVDAQPQELRHRGRPPGRVEQLLRSLEEGDLRLRCRGDWSAGKRERKDGADDRC